MDFSIVVCRIRLPTICLRPANLRRHCVVPPRPLARPLDDLLFDWFPDFTGSLGGLKHLPLIKLIIGSTMGFDCK